MKTDLFQSCGHCWVFQICWHIECSTFTASSFRVWNSSTGIPSPPLLFVVMLSKAHLSSHSRMSGSRSVITPSWLSGSWRSFLYSSSVYYCHLFLIPSASVRSIPFLSFIKPIYAWNVPLVSLIFLKRSLVFPILLLSSISLHWSLKKAFSHRCTCVPTSWTHLPPTLSVWLVPEHWLWVPCFAHQTCSGEDRFWTSGPPGKSPRDELFFFSFFFILSAVCDMLKIILH